ncbi:hypothetical protein A3709_10610 [Halioglobus sp. HI00S01]|uniref:hypothetical protein n=1 Tax=Halioglobus sp. HI00S01 TaxID=1822214 RepID=UPI0007C2A826|nr:hypothetical protein [Halioglobus sp. HI00S01]KZX51271.1 hypothetical protein A3709_10610 [Halioglobus sp. HI00S01]
MGGNLENSAPLPVGAALLNTDFTNEAKSEIGVLDAYGMPTDIFGSLQLSYSYLKATNVGQSAFAAPALRLTFFNDTCDDVISADDCFMTLVTCPTGTMATASHRWTPGLQKPSTATKASYGLPAASAPATPLAARR